MKNQILTIISLILVLAITICGCNKTDDTAIVSSKNADSTLSNEVSSYLRPALTATNDGTINLTKDLKVGSVRGKDTDRAFIDAQANFAVELFRQSVENDKNKNILISPLSVQLVLAMAFNGANGETKKEFEKLMGGITVEELNNYLYSYLNGLDAAKSTLNIANSIWVRNGFDVNKDFLKTNKNYYSADIFGADFNINTINDINKWASNKTDGMIKELLSMDDINESTVMCLINALLFDENWEYAYSASKATQEFTNINGENTTVQTLKDLVKFYYDDGKATGFKKELAGNKFSFVALLPNEDININDYISTLSGKELLKTLNNPQYVFPNTQMPEFSYEYNCDNMEETLSEMGLKTAFDQTNANFSKIDPRVYIDKFIHKTKISVNEVGVKAAAASASAMKLSGNHAKEYEVIIDRPFVYMIIDNQTNLPIFIGAVMDIE